MSLVQKALGNEQPGSGDQTQGTNPANNPVEGPSPSGGQSQTAAGGSSAVQQAVQKLQTPVLQANQPEESPFLAEKKQMKLPGKGKLTTLVSPSQNTSNPVFWQPRKRGNK